LNEYALPSRTALSTVPERVAVSPAEKATGVYPSMGVASNQKASPAARPLMTLVGAALGANSMVPPEPAKTIAPLPKEPLPSSSVPPLMTMPLAMPPAAISSKPPESMVVEIAVLAP
jgi:hypothetical protein